MTDRTAIVNPVKGKYPPQIGGTAIIAATEADLQMIARLAAAPLVEHRNLYMSHLRIFANEDCRFSLVGPVIGAPYAAMILETLVVWGVDQVLFVGWCGAVSVNVRAGDLILPETAMVDEGTSGHYCGPSCRLSFPDRSLAGRVEEALTHCGADFHAGAVWTTDAIFRETVEKVRHYQENGALAVEMEVSAIFTVAAFREIAAAGILVVSDEVSDYRWRPGFRMPAFGDARKKACQTALKVAGDSG
ncbi:nucleoside phosphorylase [Desulfosarcina sp. OttesenSCG-928-A07]|nr:nucleoside phosphorylase [Desulfosarcina sp. OttesenSCG-928-G17]MDL2329780.1 nucleoside phosphorylase [Desulfosarcina sp. OttesenSCG-928-A07]